MLHLRSNLTKSITEISFLCQFIVPCIIWWPFWTPSWISQNAQGCQISIRWIINVEGLNFKKTSKHFVYTAKHGQVKLLPDYCPNQNVEALYAYCKYHVLVQSNFRRYYFYILLDQAQILLEHFTVLDKLWCQI